MQFGTNSYIFFLIFLMTLIDFLKASEVNNIYLYNSLHHHVLNVSVLSNDTNDISLDDREVLNASSKNVKITSTPKNDGDLNQFVFSEEDPKIYTNFNINSTHRWRQNVNLLTSKIANSNKMILYWNEECIKDLPRKLLDISVKNMSISSFQFPANMDIYLRSKGAANNLKNDSEKEKKKEEEEEEEEDLFDYLDEKEYEVVDMSKTSRRSPRVYMNRGVFHKDRLSENDYYNKSTQNILRGRKIALSIIANVLGLKVSRKFASLISKKGNQDRFKLLYDESISSMISTFLTNLAIDVLYIPRLKDYKKIWGIGKVEDELLEYIRNRGSSLKLKERLFESLKCVNKIVDDYIRQPQDYLIPNDSFYKKQWYIQDDSNILCNINANKAWKDMNYYTSNPIGVDMVVAVIDTGCSKHQDLWSRPENTRFWRNYGETSCTDGIDNDKNGYIDDCWGWDFENDDNDPHTDLVGHGTSVASILGSFSNNGRGITGIYWKGKIMCLKAANGDEFKLSSTIEALDYAIKMGVKISNNSYGAFGYDEVEYSAIHKAQQHGHLFVTAAGNYGCDTDADLDKDYYKKKCFVAPGGYPLENIINVGSSNRFCGRAKFSCWGKYTVDIFAPGDGIITATPIDKNGSITCNDCYGYIQGTSFSSPIVAGVAAALWSYFEEVKPKAWKNSNLPPYMKVKNAILKTASCFKDIKGICVTGGILNFHAALHYYDV